MAIDWDKTVLGPVMGVFGEAVTFMPATGGSFAVTGVFDEAYRDVQLVDETGATSETPVLGVRLADFAGHAAPLQSDKLIVARTGTTYLVQEVRLDGHGYAKLILNEADLS